MEGEEAVENRSFKTICILEKKTRKITQECSCIFTYTYNVIPNVLSNKEMAMILRRKYMFSGNRRL